MELLTFPLQNIYTAVQTGDNGKIGMYAFTAFVLWMFMLYITILDNRKNNKSC